MSKSVTRTIAVVVGLLLSVAAVFGFSGTAFAEADEPAQLDPNATASPAAPLKPCPPLVLPTVVVTVLVPDAEPGACDDPQAETFETCLAVLAIYLGQTLTREQAAQCLPTAPEGYDDGPDLIGESGVRTPPKNAPGRLELTDTDACAQPPSSRPGVNPPALGVEKAIGLDVEFDAVDRTLGAELKIGPLGVFGNNKTIWQQMGAAMSAEPAYQPGKQKQQTTSAEAVQAANSAIQKANEEALRWKADREWVDAHPGSAPGDYPEPSGDTAYATPVDPLTDQTSVDHLPCQIARVACAAVGQRLAPALCDSPELQELKDRLCDGTAIYTTDGTACAPERISPSTEELDAAVERAVLHCLAVAHVVEGENPCDPNRAADGTQAAAGLAAVELECRSLVYVDPGAGGEDPCAVTPSEPSTPGGTPPAPPFAGEVDQTSPPVLGPPLP